MNLSLIKQETFGTVKCDLFKSDNNDILMTRKQIGEALGYSNPQKAIDKLHERYKHRLDKFSVTVTLVGTDGKKYDTYLYNSKGIYEICRWSRQPKADEFIDWAWDVIDSLRRVLLQKSTQEWQEARQQGKAFQKALNDTVKNFVEYAKSQGSRSPEKYYQHFAKLSNSAVGIQTGNRDMADMRALAMQQTVIEVIKSTIEQEIENGTYYKDVYKECKSRVGKLQEFLSVKQIAG